MAHFAQLNSDNIVIDVLKVENEVILDGEGVEQEQLGIDFLTNLTGHSNWKQTSYNTSLGNHLGGGTPFRKNYAMIGMTYDQARDAFYEPQPYSSWSLNETTCFWEAPIPRPSDDSHETPYTWNEDAYQADNTKGWELVTFDEE